MLKWDPISKKRPELKKVVPGEPRVTQMKAKGTKMEAEDP